MIEMENKNINPVDRLNDFKDRIENFAEFKNNFIKLNKEAQNEIINILKNAPGKKQYVNRVATRINNLQENGDTERINIVIDREKFLETLRERGDSTPAQREKFRQIINELPNKSARGFLEFLNRDINGVKEGKIPVLLADVECLAAVEKFNEYKDSISNFEEFSDIFDPRDKDSTDRKFISVEIIDKVNKILKEVPQEYGKKFTDHLINLHESGSNGSREKINIMVEKEDLLLELRKEGNLTQDDRKKLSQVVNGLNNEDAKSLINNLGNALKSKAPRESMMSIINESRINNQRHPLKMVRKANELHIQNPIKNTQTVGAI